MADDNTEFLKEFEEFLQAKKEKESKEKESEDFDVEIWDSTGKGVRTKRSHAKPFLQTLGIDIDPPSGKSEEGTKTTDDKKKPAGKQAGNTTATGVAAKYFTRDKK